MASTMANEDAQVLVRFVTKLPKELRVPETPVVRKQGITYLCETATYYHACTTHASMDVACGDETDMQQRLTLALAFGVSLQAVPATLKRYGLSQIINHLLALGEPMQQLE